MYKSVLVLIYCHFATANFAYTVVNVPVLVQYKEGEHLTAKLTLNRVPTFKDFHPEIYLCEEKSNYCEARKITRHNKTLTTHQIQYDVVLYHHWHKKTLEVRFLSNDGTTACHRIGDENQKFILFDMLKLDHDRTSNLSRVIYMDWGGGCSNYIYSREPEKSSAKIDGIHDRLVDNSASQSEQLILNKTLQDSDRDSTIYCGSGKTLFSDNILLQFEKTTSKTELDEDFPTTTATDLNGGANSGTAPKVLIPVVSGSVAVLILIILLVLVSRKFRSNKEPSTPTDEGKTEENELYYATTGVTYAILDLPTPSSDTPPMRDTTPYTEIIGAYKPKNQVGF